MIKGGRPGNTGHTNLILKGDIMTSQEAQSRMRRYARYLAYHSGDMLTAKHIPHYTAVNEVKHYLRQHSRDDAPRGMGNRWHWRIGELPPRLVSKAEAIMQSMGA